MAGEGSEGASTASSGREPVGDAAWLSVVTALAIVGFSLAWVLVTFLANLGLYGHPRIALEVNLYRHYADLVLAGQAPYRDFAFEYPPLALVPILGPALLTAQPLTEDGYREAFGLFGAGIGMITMIFVMRAAAALGLDRRDMRIAAVIVAASPILLGPLMLARYDLWPALFGAAAMWGIAVGRHRVAAVALGLGVLAKVYPIVLGPFIALYLWRRHGRREAATFAVTAAAVAGLGVAPFYLLAPEGVTSAFLRAFERPLQVEAIGAAVLYAVHAFTGLRLRFEHTYDSYNLAGSLPDAVAEVQTLALGAVLLLIAVLFVRGRPSLDRLVVAAAAGLCAYVALGKVLSPQYVIWLIAPLVLIRSHGLSLHLVALVAAIVLTGLYYPGAYVSYYKLREVPWILVVLVRDLILVALTGYLVLRLRESPPRQQDLSPQPPPGVPPSRAATAG